ncbi:aminotransferase class V-fold PLP-dependent enzyme [Arenibaculum pallidiluteum]|uniref:aminotransferase class V-fold PLP-dependent enzyme n=1 Tax=Arenibaculum pallidiluteum TaxID=2812559 RepID=UPI001A97254B|nr:aminotransferase class V-fold PLP-dependent enzyme [Arenibaculum pallidiluteum]
MRTEKPSDPRPAEGLRPVINVSGTMTSLGASIVVPEAVEAMAAFLPHFVEIDDLQRRASGVIARLCGSEAGYVTASASAGMTLAIAGCMTGSDLAAIERLPATDGLRNEVVVQIGHLCHYGAPVEQAIRLAGAKVVPVGTSTQSESYQLAGAITDRTAAGLYVVSHHVVGYGQIPFEEFVAECRRRGVPVIVDAASEYDLRGFVARGADIAVYSAHKFMGGPTAGIVAGRKDLVRAAFLQNRGIGRGMKVGKEGVVGAIAALRAWERRDHAAVRAREEACLSYWQERLRDLPGVAAVPEPDPTGNPLRRLRVSLDPAAARQEAWELAAALAAGDPPVIVRDHEVEHGYFYLDPCNLHPGEEVAVAERVLEECARARARNEPGRGSLAERRREGIARLLAWPD